MQNTNVKNIYCRSINMMNMSETKDIITTRLNTPNGFGVDWISNNIYWTDNEYKVSRDKILNVQSPIK